MNAERLGLSGKGTWQLRAVQVGGDSATSRYGGGAPKLFEVTHMRQVAVLDAQFRVPRQYHPGEDVFVRVDTELVP